MKANVLCSIAATLALTSPCTAAAASIDGHWTAKVPSPNGQMALDVVFVFKLDGARLAGTASANGQSYDLVDTSFAADEIAFAVEGEPARYAGTMNGDEIRMRVTYKSAENGTRMWSFVARRAAVPQPETAALEGEWAGDVPRGGGRFIAARFEFHADGATLTGVVHALDDEFQITNGTVTGTRIAFNIGGTNGDYSGELAADVIRMKVKYSGGESGRQTLGFVLTRLKR